MPLTSAGPVTDCLKLNAFEFCFSSGGLHLIRNASDFCFSSGGLSDPEAICQQAGSPRNVPTAALRIRAGTKASMAQPVR